MEEVFLPNNLTVAEALSTEGRTAPDAKRVGILYRPALLAQADVRYLNRKINIDHEETVAALAGETERGGMVRWEDVLSEPVDLDTLNRAPAPEARFAALEAPLTEKKSMKSLEKDFQDYIYHSASLRLASNATLKIVAEPGTTEEAFRALCDEAAREAREAEEDKLREKYEKKIKRLEDKLAKEERELAEDQAELSARKMEEMATHAENVFGLFTGSRSSRRVTSSLTKRRMTSKAKADVEESLDEIERFKAELADIEEELAGELDEIRERWEDAVEEIEETVITPKKQDIRMALFAVAWFPYWQLQEGEEIFELPGYAA